MVNINAEIQIGKKIVLKINTEVSVLKIVLTLELIRGFFLS